MSTEVLFEIVSDLVNSVNYVIIINNLVLIDHQYRADGHKCDVYTLTIFKITDHL